MSNEFRIKKGKLVVTPLNAPTLDEAGEVAYDSADNKLKVRDDSATRSVVTEDRAATLTNKTIDADSNTITNIENADIKAGAAIDAAKIADGSVSNAEFQRLDGVTSNIQTQLDAKIGTTLNSGQILVGNASNVATAVTPSGDVTVSNTGDVQIVAGAVTNTEVSASAAIDRTKLASGTANHVIINNGSGVLSSEAQLATTRGGTGVSSSATFPASGTVAVVPGAGVVKSNGTVLSSSNVNLATEVTGILPVANGGTGSSTQNFVDLTTAQTVDGIKTLNDSIALPDTNDASTGNVDALTIADRAAIRLTGAVTNLRGIAAGVNGQLLLVRNVSGADISVLNNNATPTAANRILTGTNGTLTLTNNASIWLKYDSTSQRWCVVGGSGSGGAGVTTTRTAAATIAIRDLVAIDSGGELTTLDSRNTLGNDSTYIGVAVNGATPGNPVLVQTAGVVSGFSSLTIGEFVYADANNPGKIVQTPVGLAIVNGRILLIGVAISATEVQLLPVDLVVQNNIALEKVKNYAGLIAQDFRTPTGTAAYWSAYADAAAAQPVDGTGGTPNVGMTVTKGSNVSQFQFNKPAANVQGQGWSADFRIDTEDTAKVMSIEFDYQTTTNYAPANNDVTVWIYNVSSGQLIQPFSFQLNGGNSIWNTFRTQFQTLATGDQYRLIFHVSTTNANNYVVQVRNLKIIRQQQSLATVITDWQDYTPTFTNMGTVINVGFRWRRVGDSLQIIGTFAPGTGTASIARIGLPTGLTIGNTSGAAKIVGNITRETAGSGSLKELVAIASANRDYIALGYVGDSGSTVSSLTEQPGNGLGTDNHHIYIPNLPISGWSGATTVLGAEQARVVAAKYRRSTTQSIPASTITRVDFATQVNDTHAAVTTGASWVFTAPVSGYYNVSSAIVFDSVAWTASQSGEMILYVNNTRIETMDFQQITASATFNLGLNGSTTVFLNAGDTVDVRLFQTRGSATNVAALPDYNYINVSRVAGPEAIGASEVVHCRVERSTAQTIVHNAAAAIIVYNDIRTDTHNAFNTTTGQYRIPVAGVYQISASTDLSLGLSMAYSYQGNIAINNTATIAVNERSGVSPSGFSVGVSADVSATVRLNAGDLVDYRVYLFNSASANRNTFGGNTAYFMITRVG